MSKLYDKYLTEHIKGVGEAYQWICDNLPGISGMYDDVTSTIMTHDQSKYSKEEYDAYDAYFYGNKSYAVVQEFNKAWLHHIHNNPHHWQHWILIEDDPETGEFYKCLEMPTKYVIEMICDWWSFSFAKGNLKEIFSWYDAHKDIMKLHKNTRKLVEIYLDEIRKKLEEHDLNYPNCGAPISDDKCAFCGTVIYDFATIDA